MFMNHLCWATLHLTASWEKQEGHERPRDHQDVQTLSYGRSLPRILSGAICYSKNPLITYYNTPVGAKQQPERHHGVTRYSCKIGTTRFILRS